MSYRKQRSAFDQVSEFERGRIVAYRDCKLSFRVISSHVGRKQTTVMRICDHWMQESTTDRRGRSHPPQCTTSLSACNIRHRLHQSGLSARRSLLGLHDTKSQTSPPGLATAIFQQDNARPHVARIVQRFHQIELLLWPARFSDLSPIENMWTMAAQ
ncbi:transposable element Tcb1 transposase [Trichonephila clavipes]|nr:transposable element Tcb1 transposase [Trichonephila clavipes]